MMSSAIWSAKTLCLQEYLLEQNSHIICDKLVNLGFPSVVYTRVSAWIKLAH
jgi:hypothetical protein